VLDLKYLTVSDLERFALNLKNKISIYKEHSNLKRQVKELDEELQQVESEILERTLLGKENPGGATT